MSIIVKQRSKNAEENACDLLNEKFFGNIGSHYLGWQIVDEIMLPDGTFQKQGEDDWRYWKSEHLSEHENLVWKHLKGLHRGITSKNAEFVPCITDECDRHHGGVSAVDHGRAVMTMARYLISRHPQYVWIAEVNPKNGSTKFFGFQLSGAPIAIKTATEVAQKIHDDLLPFIGSRECFPFNCKAVGLPMRTGKTTIVSSGRLPMVQRKRKVNGSFEFFRTYSAVAFLREISSGRRHFCFETLKRELLNACRNKLPVKETKPETSPKEAVALQSGKKFSELKDIANEPDALVRMSETHRFLCRKARRVVSASELLSAYRDNGLYSGNWSDNEKKREDRASSVVAFTAQTFDPIKCGEGKSTRAGLNERLRGWRAKLQPSVVLVTLRSKKTIDEYGQEVRIKGRTFRVKRRDVLGLGAIIEHVIADRSKDQRDRAPRESIFGWARELEEEGLMSRMTNDYYLACRVVLEREFGLKVDHEYSREQGVCKRMRFEEDERTPADTDIEPESEGKYHLELNGCVVSDTLKSSPTPEFQTIRPPPDD